MTAAPVVLETRGLAKTFGATMVLEGFDLTVRRGEIVALVGKSGAGKSTALRCLNLLERPDRGALLLEGHEVDLGIQGRPLAEHRARVGMVFQHLHLFPHLDAAGNIMEAPMRVLGWSRGKARAQALDLLDGVGLRDRAGAFIDQLSGGQQQRVAIARALAMAPRVLLLDEITSALDVENIASLRDLLHTLAESGVAMVLVTHDLSFVKTAAHRMCFVDNGRVTAEGAPASLLQSPTTESLRSFLQAAGRDQRES